MTDYHPITPPPELVKEWTQYRGYSCADELWDYLAAQAAQWGADMELEACLGHLLRCGFSDADILRLRAARRPQPLSRKEQALEAIGRLCASVIHDDLKDDAAIVRRALEALPE